MQSERNRELTVIVPCYNEEKVIHEFYTRTKTVLNSMTDIDSYILFINDGSKDNTKGILTALALADKQVKVIHFSRNFGHQAAVTAGLNTIDSDLVIIIDSDLQDPPELIPDIIKKYDEQEANVVYCVRKERKGETWFKKRSAALFYRTMNNLSEVQFPQDTGDFRLIDQKVLRAFNEFKEKGKYIRGLISWIGFKQVPFYYVRDARFAGETKYPFKKMLTFAATALLYFSKKPLKLAMNLGIFAFLIGIVYALWVWIGYWAGFTHSISGWTSIIILIIFFGGVQLLTIGVLGQYIGVLFDEVKDRPEYIIDQKYNFEKEVEPNTHHH